MHGPTPRYFMGSAPRPAPCTPGRERPLGKQGSGLRLWRRRGSRTDGHRRAEGPVSNLVISSPQRRLTAPKVGGWGELYSARKIQLSE